MLRQMSAGEPCCTMMFAIDSATPNPSFHVARGFMRSSGTSLSGNQYSDNRCFTLTKHPVIAGTPCPSPPPAPPALPVVAALRGCDEFYRRYDLYQEAQNNLLTNNYDAPGTIAVFRRSRGAVLILWTLLAAQ